MSHPAPLDVQAKPVRRLTWADATSLLALLGMFAAAQALAVFLGGPFRRSGVDRAFEDPTNPLNALWLLVIVVVFTIVILLVARWKLYWIIQALILGSVGLTLVYVIFPLLELLPVPQLASEAAAGVHWSVLIALLPAALLTFLLVKFPEWYIVDTVGIAISAATVAIFGASFTPTVYLLVLVAFAIYDYVSVYRTKHMLTLADKVLDLHLPIMLIVPRTLDYSFLDEKGRARERAEETPGARKPRDAMFIGLGDVVIPSIFGVSALLHVGTGAALGTFVGVDLALLVLLWFVLRGRPHAGLPTLNAGALVGFFVGHFVDKGTLVFW